MLDIESLKGLRITSPIRGTIIGGFLATSRFANLHLLVHNKTTNEIRLCELNASNELKVEGR